MAKNLAQWSPFGAMRKLDPFTELRNMQHEMERLYDRFLGKEGPVSEIGYGEWMPAVESYVKDNNLVFKCELPGVCSKHLDVTFDENSHQLVIKGERKTDKDTKEADYLYREFTYGAFERRFTLPEGIKSDQVKAKFAYGILEITAPLPAVSKAKKIEIETPKPAEAGAETAVKKAA
jgi:HSP20 family protein